MTDLESFVDRVLGIKALPATHLRCSASPSGIDQLDPRIGCNDPDRRRAATAGGSAAAAWLRERLFAELVSVGLILNVTDSTDAAAAEAEQSENEESERRWGT